MVWMPIPANQLMKYLSARYLIRAVEITRRFSHRARQYLAATVTSFEPRKETFQRPAKIALALSRATSRALSLSRVRRLY